MKWWFGLNLPKEPQASTYTGDQLHSLAESYLRAGAVPESSPVADMFIDALEHLPYPGAQSAVEQRHEVRIDGVLFVTKLDWLGDASALPGFQGRGRAFLDHKTSRDPKAYGIWSEAAALDDEQQIIYRLAYSAEHARYVYFEKTRRTLLCELELQNRLTPFDSETYERKHRSAMRGRVSNKTYVSDISIALPRVYEAFQTVVLPHAKRLIELKLHPVEQNEVAYNIGACQEYGGCQRKAICPRYQDALRNPQPQDDGGDYWAVDGDSTMPLDLFGSLPAAPAAPVAATPSADVRTDVVNLFGALPAAPAVVTSAPMSTSVPAAAAATPINGPSASTMPAFTPESERPMPAPPRALDVAHTATQIIISAPGDLTLSSDEIEVVKASVTTPSALTLALASDKIPNDAIVTPTDAEIGRAVRMLIALWRHR